MTLYFLNICVIVLSSFGSASCIYYYYMDKHCSRTVDISSKNQVRVKTKAYGNYDSNMACKMTLKVNPGFKMMVYFKDLSTQSCPHDYLSLYDGSSTTVRTLGSKTKYCGTTYPSTILTTTGRYLTLSFHSDHSVQRKGFDIVVTEYSYAPCFSSEYSCSNERCIDASLKCNGYNPCGDNSDCTQGGSSSNTSSSLIGFLIVLAIVACIAVPLIKRYNQTWRSWVNGGRQMRPSVVSTVSFPGIGSAPNMGNGPPPPYWQHQSPASQPQSSSSQNPPVYRHYSAPAPQPQTPYPQHPPLYPHFSSPVPQQPPTVPQYSPLNPQTPTQNRRDRDSEATPQASRRRPCKPKDSDSAGPSEATYHGPRPPYPDQETRSN